MIIGVLAEHAAVGLHRSIAFPGVGLVLVVLVVVGLVLFAARRR
jgi:hypothetical protein